MNPIKKLIEENNIKKELKEAQIREAAENAKTMKLVEQSFVGSASEREMNALFLLAGGLFPRLYAHIVPSAMAFANADGNRRGLDFDSVFLDNTVYGREKYGSFGMIPRFPMFEFKKDKQASYRFGKVIIHSDYTATNDDFVIRNTTGFKWMDYVPPKCLLTVERTTPKCGLPKHEYDYFIKTMMKLNEICNYPDSSAVIAGLAQEISGSINIIGHKHDAFLKSDGTWSYATNDFGASC